MHLSIFALLVSTIAANSITRSFMFRLAVPFTLQDGTKGTCCITVAKDDTFVFAANTKQFDEQNCMKGPYFVLDSTGYLADSLNRVLTVVEDGRLIASTKGKPAGVFQLDTNNRLVLVSNTDRLVSYGGVLAIRPVDDQIGTPSTKLMVLPVNSLPVGEPVNNPQTVAFRFAVGGGMGGMQWTRCAVISKDNDIVVFAANFHEFDEQNCRNGGFFIVTTDGRLLDSLGRQYGVIENGFLSAATTRQVPASLRFSVLNNSLFLAQSTSQRVGFYGGVLAIRPINDPSTDFSSFTVQLLAEGSSVGTSGAETIKPLNQTSKIDFRASVTVEPSSGSKWIRCATFNYQDKFIAFPANTRSADEQNCKNGPYLSLDSNGQLSDSLGHQYKVLVGKEGFLSSDNSSSGKPTGQFSIINGTLVLHSTTEKVGFYGGFLAIRPMGDQFTQSVPVNIIPQAAAFSATTDPFSSASTVALSFALSVLLAFMMSSLNIA
jgi:hypothetical protein